MKKIRFGLLFACIMIAFCNVFAEEVDFQLGNWEDIKDQAQKSGKYIFVDAYTDWCGWCKVMDKETFTNSEVIDFLKQNFLPVKYEMEQDFGKVLAMKYRVWAFPSQLFFNPSGKLVYVSEGYQKPQEFLKTLKKVLEREEQINFKGISDNMDLPYPDFYKASFEKNGSKEKKWPDSSEVNTFLDKQQDLFTEVNWSVMAHFQTNDKCNNFFLENKNKYEELYGKNAVKSKIYSIIYNKFNNAALEKSEEQLAKVFEMIEKYDSKDAENNILFYRGMFYERTENWKKYSEYVDEQIKSGKINNDKINEYAWTIYEKSDDKTIIEKALFWIKPVIEKEPNYMNLDTYASLLYKSKNYAEAKIYAEKAIELGKKNNDNVDATMKLLDKINENK